MKHKDRFHAPVRLRRGALAALLALLFLLAGCAGNGTGAGAQSPAPSEGGAAENEVPKTALFGDFKTEDTEGNTVTNDVFADYEVTMVNIWASFCGPCVREMPDLKELNDEYAEQGFQVVGIIGDATDAKGNVDEAILADALEIIESTGADYTHILPSAAMFGAYLKGVSGFPTTVFVNSRGEILGSAYVGAMSKAEWAAIIEEKLG